MKPCCQFKERIALAIVARQTDVVLEEHLAQCAACRAYADEIHAIRTDHTERATHLPYESAPLRLHGKLRAALNSTGRRWTWIRPVAASAFAALAVGLYLHWRPLPKPIPMVAAPAPPRRVIEPSYAAYRNQLSRSADELDAALSRYDAGVGTASELFTVSTRALTLP